jgi:hypothetical protein
LALQRLLVFQHHASRTGFEPIVTSTLHTAIALRWKKILHRLLPLFSSNSASSERNYLLASSVSTHRTFGICLATWKAERESRFMESVVHSEVNSEVRELCKAVSQEEDPEQMESLLDELLSMLDERQLMASLL